MLPLSSRVCYAGGPGQVEPPFTILVCPVAPDHEHIDMVYFCRLTSGYPGVCHDPENPIFWFSERELEAGGALSHGVEVAFPPDVQALGIEAIRLAKMAAGARAR